MHTRASNSKLVEPLSEPERTMNRRLSRQNRIFHFERRNERPAQPRIVYLPILDINYFRHFLDILENYNPMDDEPMWAADRVVALTPGSAITILETTNEFAIKGSSNYDTDKIMTRIDVMTMKMDARYKEMQSCSNHSIHEYDKDDKPISNSDDKPDLQRQLSEFRKDQQSTNSFVKDTFMDLKTKLETTTKNHQSSIQNLEAKLDRFADKQSGRPSGSLPNNTQPNPKEFDIEINDKRGTENVVADHLSRIENDETSAVSEVDDNFSGETLMEITTRDIPWCADFANYFVGPETRTILDQCHHGPTGVLMDQTTQLKRS
ncbi:hypothetical protein Tco_0570625 [Tanacetum coccineum]